MLTERLLASVGTPLTRDDGIDLHAELTGVLGDIGLKPSDCGGEIAFVGADPIVPGVVATASAASLGLVAKSVAIAAVGQHRGLGGQDISMDLRVAPHRLCPFYDGKWELLNGFMQGNDFDRLTALLYTRFYRTADDRWVLPQAHYPRQRADALRLLGVNDDVDAVTAAIARRHSAELEAAGAEAGVVLPVLRTTAEFLAEAQYRNVLADLPLIEIERIGDSAPEPLVPGVAPLGGIRALGFSHVIAGGGIGRTLALHGADALNVWTPFAYEAMTAFHTAQYGVRTTRIALDTAEGAARMRELARTGDVFYANRRARLLSVSG